MNAPTPGSPEWLRLVTASKVAAIIGVSPYDSPRSMWHKMRGDVTDDRPESAAMSRGNYLEAGVLDWWEGRHEEYRTTEVRRQFYATRPDLPWAAATLDGLGVDPFGEVSVVEVKTTSRMDDWGTPGTDEIPTHYLTQVYWQLAMVPEATRAYVAVLGPFLEFAEYVVERDEAIQADLIARCRAFYDSLAGDERPALDDHVATFDVLKRLHPDIDRDAAVDLPDDLAAEYVAATGAVDDAKARATAAQSRVLDAMQDARLAVAGGVTIARRQPNRYGVSLVRVAKTYTPASEQEHAA